MISDYQLGGAMVWSIDLDDFSGRCGKKYPLLQAVHRGLFPQKSNEKTTTEIVGTTTSFWTTDEDFFTTNSITTNTVPDIEMTTKQFLSITKPTGGSKSPTRKPIPIPIINNSTQDWYEDYPVHIHCKSHGNYVRHPRRCDVFYRCVFNGRRLEPVRFMCAYPLVFDNLHSVCNWVYKVKC